MRFTLASRDERQKAQDQLDASSLEKGGELFDVRKERKFVRKLDCILVTWAFFAYLLKVSPKWHPEQTEWMADLFLPVLSVVDD